MTAVTVAAAGSTASVNWTERVDAEPVLSLVEVEPWV